MLPSRSWDAAAAAATRSTAWSNPACAAWSSSPSIPICRLCRCPARRRKSRLVEKLTKGLGAGAVPEVGRRSAEESREEIAGARRALTLCLSPRAWAAARHGRRAVVAEIAREQGALTIAVVTKPFAFEGKQRMRNAEAGILTSSSASIRSLSSRMTGSCRSSARGRAWLRRSALRTRCCIRASRVSAT